MNRFEILMKLIDGIQGRRKLGKILMESHQLTRDELEQALDAQRQDPYLRKLGYILIDKGFVSPTELMEALSKQLEVCIPFGVAAS